MRSAACNTKGNNFSSGLIKRGDEQSIGAIKKRYLSGQGDSPVIANHDGSKHRWLTLSEIRRLFELPDSYILNICKTTAGEILGQGVVIGLFAQVIKSISNFEIDHELYQPELF